ncbi:chemotaxis protein CheA [Halegenticoccus tardaugens]|uniref:chemotaxis protein CheA n=1 Tax=Halegenticoccus tardaugens TaxID=2071624 RepID=UPI00100AA1BB|nr:chemotaxis protein CheA [Halegenticoccus tardaugens]
MEDEYRRSFVREGEEQITELNNSLLAMESNPDDREATDAIFRTAHTLKGNAAAMGFDRASGLAHALEDLLDEVREGRLAASPALVDLLFEAVDGLELILAGIDADGEEPDVGADETEARIRRLIDGGAEDSASNRPRSSPSLRPAARASLADRATSGGERVFRARVEIEGGGMKGVDGLVVLRAAEEAFGGVETVPDADAIEAGEYDGGFDLFVVADDDAAVESAVAGAGPVDSVVVEDVTDVEGDGADGDGPATAPAARAASRTAGGKSEIASIRVDVGQLDTLYGLIEQLVTSRIKLRRELADAGVKKSDNLDELDKISSNLQNTVMDMRLIPLSKVVDKFPRLVRDVAREQGKRVNFVVDGEDVELDRTILTEIRDPLMHVLRNAVDHGVEPPGERERAGKPAAATVSLTATRERDHVTVEVADDGRGLELDAIREKDAEKGVKTRSELDAMSDSETYDLVFHPGFSTAEEVTDISGRGVGMDVVRSTVTRLDGTVSVDSEPGGGTTVRIRLPVTVAIVKVMFVRVGDAEYGIPVKNVDEIARRYDVRTVNGTEVVEHDDEVYPIVRLGDALDEPAASTNGDGMLLRIRPERRRVALHCDEVLDQEEVVVKPLEGVLSGIPGLSGTAVLGDGDVVAILDVVTV